MHLFYHNPPRRHGTRVHLWHNVPHTYCYRPYLLLLFARYSWYWPKNALAVRKTVKFLLEKCAKLLTFLQNCEVFPRVTAINGQNCEVFCQNCQVFRCHKVKTVKFLIKTIKFFRHYGSKLWSFLKTTKFFTKAGQLYTIVLNCVFMLNCSYFTVEFNGKFHLFWHIKTKKKAKKPPPLCEINYLIVFSMNGISLCFT